MARAFRNCQRRYADTSRRHRDAHRRIGLATSLPRDPVPRHDETDAGPPAGATLRAHDEKWWVVGAMAMPLFLIAADINGVTVALARIGDQLGAPASERGEVEGLLSGSDAAM